MTAMAKKKRRAAIYCRISRDVEQTGLGVARQEYECRALAERHGFEVLVAGDSGHRDQLAPVQLDREPLRRAVPVARLDTA